MEERMSRTIWYPGHELLLTDIVRAENCHLYDSRGTRYVDLESGVWCTSVGHGNERILRVIAEQSALISHGGFNYSSEIVEEAAREILALLGLDEGRCVFLCSGSEAVEYGVRVAKMIAGRPLMMTMADSYFGAYGSAMRRAEGEWFSFDWFACTDCPDAAECGGDCEHWAAVPFERIGGFLLEPGSSSGLVRFPPEKLVRNIVRAIGKNDGLVLVNEVTTGVGRTGKWFGYQHYRLSPDVVAIGKGIGNGYPVSVTAFSSRLMRRLGGRPVMYAQSHQNDPLGAAVVREVVRVIRENGLIERCGEISSLLMSGLEDIGANSSRVGDIRGRGLMAAIELEDDAENSFTIWAHRELARRGFIVGRRPNVPVLRLDPGLTIDRADIEAFLDTLEEVLEAGEG
jgi:acetylornithine/N-succinyldiaminopimelate aminotransferase